MKYSGNSAISAQYVATKVSDRNFGVAENI